MPENLNIWHYITLGLYPITLVLIGLVWNDMRQRVAVIEVQMAAKADKSELAKEQAAFAIFRESLHKVEVQLSGIDQQISRYNSEMESEKRTRRDANIEQNRKLDRLLERRNLPRDEER